MKLHLIAVGDRMPDWVRTGYEEYAKRLPPECGLNLIEISPGRRGKHRDLARTIRDEGASMLAAIPTGARQLALDVQGKAWSTEELAVRLDSWLAGGRDIALLVGGPDGLAPACLASSEERWSLSPLTFPHPLVRVIIAEQLYRAWSILRGHPYHRG
jgi:23S rRNA (pseudouridine1915-N3)-methyltransferase